MSPQAGIGAFETLGAVGGELPLWERHMARLASAADRLAIAFDPPADLAARAAAMLDACGHDVVRITLSVGGDGVPQFDVATRARRPSGPSNGPSNEIVTLHRVRVTRSALDPTAGFKSTSRELYDGALVEAQAAGADDALLVDERNRVLETSTANVLVAVGGALCTPPLDGRIVPGIARAVLLEGLASAGHEVIEREIGERELSGARGLWVTNAVYGPRPAAMAGGPAPSPDPLLAAIWAGCLRSADLDAR